MEEIRRIAQLPVSKTPIGEEEDSQLGDFIEDRRLPTRRRPLPDTCSTSRSRRCSTPLRAKAREVLHYRFGLEDGHSYTLEEVGKRFG